MRIVETLRIRVPENLYVASSGLAVPSQKRPEALRQPPVQIKKDAPSAPAAARREDRKRPRRRRFQLPQMPRRLETAQTILQPQFAPDLTPPTAIRLPEVFFWAPRKELPRFVKPFVEPGHETAPAQPRLLDAPPKLELPASEPAALSIPQIPDSHDALRLVTPPALPVQASEPQNGAPQTGVSADRTSGDPTNLLSLALDPQRMREFLSVPPGNQLGQLPEGGASGPAALTAASGSGDGSAGSGSGASGGSHAVKPVESAPVSPAQAGAAKPVESAVAPPAPADSAEAGAASAAAWRAMALAAAAPTRIVNPAGGVFDVVVQSDGTEGFPESAGTLSGKPIYSAYVRAGGGKDWLLQYCIPAEEDVVAEVSGYVVRLTTGAPLIAPYPRVTMRPPVKPRPGHHVMVHGYITVEGRFRDLKVLSASAASEAEMVEAVLEQWEFRPASRDGKPLQVEILLAIPAE
ncbi:MAG: hypothetical protein ABSH46_19935 [Bryobacteraceae bacterium]